MGFFGHTCKLPWMERPMGPCPACQYSREMADLAARGAALRALVLPTDADRVDSALAVDPAERSGADSRSIPQAVGTTALTPSVASPGDANGE